MEVCRICLVRDTGLYDLGRGDLKTSYENLTNGSLTNDPLPWRLCWECRARLLSCNRFRAKALRGQALLADISSFNLYNFSIDRKKHKLISSLTRKTFINHNDLHLHETSNERDGISITESIPIQEININEVKSEDELYNDDINIEIHLESSSDELLVKHKSKREKKTKKDKKKKEPKIDRRRKPASEVLNEALFSITDLTFDEQIEEIRKRKETANYKNSVFKCEDCYKGFLDEEAFKSHVIRHTDQSGQFVCSVCATHFKQAHALRNHAASHLQRFSCQCCPYVTTRRHAAKLHEEWHNGTRYQCPHCQEDFVKFSTYMGHIRIKHPSDFVCQLCGHSFVSEKGLSLHKKLKHRFHQQPVPENGPYCQPCDVRFATEEALEKHVKLSARHSDETEMKENGRRRGRRAGEGDNKLSRKPRGDKPEGPIPCEQCGVQLPDSLSYYRHFRRTHPDKNRTNYPSMKSKSMCEVCGKMFQSLALLQDHSFTHTDAKLFACQLCGKSFQRKYRLIAHRRLHGATRASHDCAACGKRFTTASNRQRHMILCGKNFQCKYRLIAHRRLHGATRASHDCAACGKRFTTASNRQRHMISHTGLKPFKCEMCGKSFKHASEKRAHITYVHLKKPWPKRARGKRRPDTRQLQQPQQPLPGELSARPWPGCGDPKLPVPLDDKSMYIM